jgi:hypothetical protein
MYMHASQILLEKIEEIVAVATVNGAANGWQSVTTTFSIHVYFASALSSLDTIRRQQCIYSQTKSISNDETIKIITWHGKEAALARS